MAKPAMSPIDKTLFDNPLMTVDELAAFLKVSVRTINRWMAVRHLPYKQIGEWSVRFEKSEVARWLQKRSVNT